MLPLPYPIPPPVPVCALLLAVLSGAHWAYADYKHVKVSTMGYSSRVPRSCAIISVAPRNVARTLPSRAVMVGQAGRDFVGTRLTVENGRNARPRLKFTIRVGGRYPTGDENTGYCFLPLRRVRAPNGEPLKLPPCPLVFGAHSISVSEVSSGTRG